MSDKTVSVRVRFEGGDQVKTGLQGVGREAERTMDGLSRSSGQAGSSLQNAGFQVSDFFVQVSSGTDPTRALAQQLPQLLQGFGLVGVAASVLVAAMPSLWALFNAGAADADELADRVNALTEAMNDYKRAASASDGDPSKLFESFGASASQAQEVLDIQREIAAVRAKGALDQASGSIASFLGGDAARIEAYRVKIKELESDLAAMRANARMDVDFNTAAAEADIEKLQGRLDRMNAEVVENLSSSMAVNEEGAARIVDALGAVAEASTAGPREQAAAMAGLRSSITDAAAAGGVLSEETLVLLDNLTNAELAALGLASVDIASNIGSGANEAGRLADNLARASGLEYGKIANKGGLDSVARDTMREYTPNPFGRIAGGAGGVYTPPPNAGRAAGGGGGGDPDLARAVALTASLRTETEKYAESLGEIDRLKAKGLITDETYTRQLDKMNEKLDGVSDMARQAAGAIKTAFTNVFDDPKEALEDLAKQLASMALMEGLGKLLPGLFGTAGMFGGAIPGFAAGGRHSGGLRIVGENGPELEYTGPSTILPNDMLRGMRGGGGGGTSVQVINNTGQPTTQQKGRGPDGREVVRVIVGEEIAAGRLDGANRARFGVTPRPVKR